MVINELSMKAQIISFIGWFDGGGKIFISDPHKVSLAILQLVSHEPIRFFILEEQKITPNRSAWTEELLDIYLHTVSGLMNRNN